MPGIKITELDSAIGAPADSDLLVIVDISTNTTKQITVQDLLSGASIAAATSLDVVKTNTNATFYPNFTDVSQGISTAVYSDSDLRYNASTGILTAEKFSGDGSLLTGVLADSAENAKNVLVSSINTGILYPTLAATSTGNQVLKSDASLTYDAATNTLNAVYFVGDGSGLTNLNLGAGTAATTVNIVSTNLNASHYLTFVGVSSGNDSVNVDTDLTYNPSTNTLTAGSFAGDATSLTNVDADTINVSPTSTSATYYLTFTGLSTGSDSVNTNSNITVNPSTGTVSALSFSGNGSSLTSVNGSTISIATSSTNSSHYLLFTELSSGSDSVNTDADLTYNPSTNTLTAGYFAGDGSGLTNLNADARNIQVVSTNTNGTFYLVFTGISNGTDSANTDTDLTYNPSTNTLTATTFSGAFSGDGSNLSNVPLATLSKTLQIKGKTSTSDVLDLLFATTASSRSDNTLYTDSVGVSDGISFVPSTGTLQVASVAGTADYALVSRKIGTKGTMASSSALEILFGAGVATRSDGTLYVDSVGVAEGFTYTPSTGTVTASYFAGDGSNLTNVVASSATLSTNTSNVAITAVSTDADHFMHFGTASSGNDDVNVDIDLLYNPSTNALKLDADGSSLSFGEDSDLIISHSGTHGYVDVITGNLYVRDALDSVHSLFDIATGDLHVDGDIIAFSTTIASDPKLKYEIKPLENALERVRELNGVSWKWKSDNTPSAGVISTDVKKVLSEAISIHTGLNDGETYESVNYDAIIGLLIEAVKDLSNEITALKSKDCGCGCKV